VPLLTALAVEVGGMKECRFEKKLPRESCTVSSSG